MDEEYAVFEQSTVNLSSLRKFLETESPLKMLKNVFHLKYSSPSHDI